MSRPSTPRWITWCRAACALSVPLLLAPSLTTLSTGCGSACTGVESTHEGGRVIRTGALVIYDSSPTPGQYLPFDGARLWHFKHHLGFVPIDEQIELSFSEFPFTPGGGGAAKVAGNQAVVVARTSDEVAIKNDSCASYYIRVVIKEPDPNVVIEGAREAVPPPAPDAAAADGSTALDAGSDGASSDALARD